LGITVSVTTLATNLQLKYYVPSQGRFEDDVPFPKVGYVAVVPWNGISVMRMKNEVPKFQVGITDEE